MEVIKLNRQHTLLGSGLTAVFHIATYLVYVNKILKTTDVFTIFLIAFIYFVPGMVEMIEDIQNGRETRSSFFVLKIVGTLLSLGYIGMLWYFVSQYDQPIPDQLHWTLRTAMILLPAAFLIRSVIPICSVIEQLYNKNVIRGNVN